MAVTKRSNQAKVVRVPVLQVPVLLASGTLRTGGTQSFWPPMYPEDWRDSVFLAPRYRVDWRDSVLSGPRYPVDHRDSVLFAPQVPWALAGLSTFGSPGTLGTCRTQSFQPPRYPMNWWDSVSFRPPGNLGTARHGRTCLSRYIFRVYVYLVLHIYTMAQNVKNVDLYLYLFVFSYYKNQMECLEHVTYVFNTLCTFFF